MWLRKRASASPNPAPESSCDPVTPATPEPEDFLTATLHHGNLQVDTADPGPRPMIAVLDARPSLEDAFRQHITELVRAVRREPGCVTFTAYEARDTPGRFYLYEIYTDAAAFETLPGPGWQLLSRGQAPK